MFQTVQEYVGMRQSLLAGEIFSVSADTTFGKNANLDTWGTNITPGLGPYAGTHAGVEGY